MRKQLQLGGSEKVKGKKGDRMKNFLMPKFHISFCVGSSM